MDQDEATFGIDRWDGRPVNLAGSGVVLRIEKGTVKKLLTYLEMVSRNSAVDLIREDATNMMGRLSQVTGIELDDSEMPVQKASIREINGQKYRMVSQRQGEERMKHPHNPDDVLFLEDRYYLKL